MINYEVVQKIIGQIRPIGKSEVDAIRLENLKQMCNLMEEIHIAIDSVAYDFKDSTEDSVKACCDYANKYIDTLGIAE